MLALAALWWPWHTGLAYNITRSLSTEDYVMAAKVVGASDAHIIFVEILPNCLPSILTKMTLDMGFVLLVASSLSFLGLGVQPPTPRPRHDGRGSAPSTCRSFGGCRCSRDWRSCSWCWASTCWATASAPRWM